MRHLLLSDVLQARVREYAPANGIEQENMLAELMQHYVLASLSRSGLFSTAIFHGGTCLRICQSMNRFSEDLDFLLKQPDRRFAWEPHLKRIAADCEAEGLRFEIQDKNQAVDAVLSFPTTAPITTQTLSSGFATKTHALLCRRYIKGRDWYDFLWYVARRTVPDLGLLSNALFQQGPWQGKRLAVSVEWLLQALRTKIESVDWKLARDDVRRFLPLSEQRGLDSWTADLFLHHVERMAAHLAT